MDGKTARPGQLPMLLAAAAVVLSVGGCGATVPACPPQFTNDIYLLREPSTAEWAAVRIDPGRARQAAVDHLAASGSRPGIAPVGICLAVPPDPDPVTGAVRVVYAVRFEDAEVVEVTLVDAVDGHVVSNGSVYR